MFGKLSKQEKFIIVALSNKDAIDVNTEMDLPNSSLGGRFSGVADFNQGEF